MKKAKTQPRSDAQKRADTAYEGKRVNLMGVPKGTPKEREELAPKLQELAEKYGTVKAGILAGIDLAISQNGLDGKKNRD